MDLSVPVGQASRTRWRSKLPYYGPVRAPLKVVGELRTCPCSGEPVGILDSEPIFVNTDYVDFTTKDKTHGIAHGIRPHAQEVTASIIQSLVQSLIFETFASHVVPNTSCLNQRPTCLFENSVWKYKRLPKTSAALAPSDRRSTSFSTAHDLSNPASHTPSSARRGTLSTPFTISPPLLL
ncbi:hypothetical protein EDB84DRAFT_547979 [Lactarius hengduanensis]|nr:hypothetical protein EDB84DRAFT_547979 [Lactarius hengduanensis]